MNNIGTLDHPSHIVRKALAGSTLLGLHAKTDYTE